MPLPLVRPLLALVHWSDGIVDWLLTYALHSTILIAAAWLVAASPLGRRLRLTSASWLWLVALCGGVLTATLQATGALAPVAGTVRLAAHTPVQTRLRLEIVERSVDAPTIAGSPREALTAKVDLSPRWPVGLVLGWIAGALLMLSGFALARWRFFRLLAARRDAEFTLAGSALREVRRRAGVHRPIRLSVAAGLASPVAIGRHEICLPERALSDLDLAQQESMLAHELAHLERRDAHWLYLARLIEAAFFFQPLNRLARRRMQDAAEFASDGWALGVLARPVVLARCLARVAEWSLTRPRLLAPAMAAPTRSMLVQRVERLTSGRAAGERAAGPAAAALVLGGLLALALLAPSAAVGAPAAPTVSGFGRAADVRMMRLGPPSSAGRIVFRGVRGRNEGEATEPGEIDEVIVMRFSSLAPPEAHPR